MGALALEGQPGVGSGAHRCGAENMRDPLERQRRGPGTPGGGSWGPALSHTLAVEHVTGQGTWPSGSAQVACSVWVS